MSENPAADPVDHTQAAPDRAGQPAAGKTADQKSMAESRNALIGRDLNDIYLLLDHLSGRPDRHVSTLQLDQPNKRYWKDPPDSGEKPFITRNLIQSVCEIEWPPNDPNSRYSAIAATTLFTARDILNDIAAPASGMTIAFTIMVIVELKSRGAKASRSILRRKTTTKSETTSSDGETTSYNAAKKPYDAEQIPPKKEPPKAGDEPEAETPVEQADRTKLAKDAYPHLEESAKKLGGMIGSYNRYAVIFIVFAAVLSWNVASGKLILERLNDLKLRSATEAARIVTAEQGGSQEITISTGAADYVPDAGSTLDTLCDSSTGVARSAVSLVAEQKSNVSRDALCEAGFAIIAQRHATDLALASWYGGWSWVPFLTTAPTQVVQNVSLGSPNPLSALNTKNYYRVMVRDAAFPEQQAGDLNTILASYVLPMIYGLVGAAAAVIRGLNRKMLESSLAPRDISASRVQLLLGVIIGACIGLFVSPTGAPDAQLPSVTLAGNAVALSASAFSFISGFGVEAVFRWIETLIAVAFAAGAGAAGSSTTTLVQQARRQAG